MRRNLLALLFGTLYCITSQAQGVVTTVYHEKFDPISGPDSVTTYNTNSLLNSEWNDTNNLFVSSPKSYHSKVVPFDSVIFETTSFSTLNNVYVRLKFNQICKIHFGQRGYIQVSNNNGATWQNVTGAMYQGPSPQFSATGYFNELSYPSASSTPYWYGPTLSAASAVNPTNSWWSAETFNVSTILGGVNGYAQCRVRFIVVHQINTTINLSGWYVDNLLVEAAPCELQPPTFTYNVVPPRKPVGARYMISEELKLKARDNTGVDSVLVFWRSNGGAWTHNKMTALTSGSCPDSSIYTYTWNNIALHDTIDWYVNIYDCACPNITRDPIIAAIPNYYTFWRDVAPPAICGPTYPNSFPKVITSLPYIEDFENNAFWTAGTGTGNAGTSHRGTFPTENPPVGLNWTVSPNAVSTGFAWSVRTGATGTALTGPAGNNTPGGNKYLYSEASQGNGSATNPIFTQVITPCIDLKLVNCAALEFYYHMYGANIDRLRVDIDTGTATSKYVNGIWQAVGQQQTSQTAPYLKAFVSLEQFSGRIIRIRFTARKNTATAQDKNDIAIDDIKVFEPTPVDVEMTNYVAPLNGFCGYSNAELVKGKLQSLGCQTLTSIPIACKIERTTPGGVVMPPVYIRDTLDGSYPLGSDTSFTFAPTANLSAYGTYKLWIYSEVDNDTVNSNDTVGPYFIEHRQPITAFPYIMTFDTPSTTPGTGVPGNNGVTGTTDWDRIPDPANGGYAWYVGTGKTPTAATGPRNDYSGKGNYLYAEGNYGTAPTSAILASKCIDLTGMTAPSIEFMYHMLGTDIGALALQVVPANSNTWINIPGASITGAVQTASIEQWKYFKADLTTWAGQVIKIRFIAQKTGLGSAADIALDDIRIYNRIATDVGILQINLPAQRIDSLAPVAPQFVIRNFGTTSVTGVPITYTITPTCGPNAGVAVTYTTTYAGTIAAGAEFIYNVPAANMPNYPTGTFEICAYTTKTGDTHAFNNTLCKTSNGWPIVYIQNGFNENFDACNNGVAKGFWINGDYRTFAVGNTTFSSSPNSYSTYEFQYNSYPNTNEYLYAPRFVGFDTIVGAQLWMTQKFQFGAGDVGVLEYLTGSTWTPLGFQDPDNAIGINWYNGANLPAVSNGSGFIGSTSSWPGNTNGWITSMWPLNVFNFSMAPLVLRLNQVSAGGGTSGWAIDNFEIRIPPQNSASPHEIDTYEFLVFPNQPTTLQVKVQNTGAKRLDSCMVSYSIDGGPFTTPEMVLLNPKLITGRVAKDYYNFIQKWMNPISGTHTICVVTSRPNNKQDNYTQDDTLCVQIKVLDEIVFTPTDTVYCNTFDDPTQVEWIEKNTFNKKGLTSWQKGTPNQAPITAAHSAPNAWMTKLSQNYKTRDSSALFTPVFVADSGATFDISFWHNFKTELYHDGGTLDISFDGTNWRTVGYVLPNGKWFNTTHVTSLDVLLPGWSGESGGWIESKIKIQFDQFRKAVFRFRFASDQSFEYQGWALDDFCMKASTGEPDDFIGVNEEVASDLIGVGNVIPNPTSGVTQIPYVMNSPADIKVSVYSLLGQQLLNFNQNSEVGINYINFDVSGWTAGMYIVTIDVNGEQVTRKVVVR